MAIFKFMNDKITLPQLYFTNPIKALYMMKEFGVNFIAGDQVHYDYSTCLPYTLEHLSKREKFYVVKESEHIFEPKERDLINYKSRSGKNKITATYLESFIDDDNQAKWKLQSQGMNSPKIYRIDQKPYEIIMRDGKQFFNPNNR